MARSFTNRILGGVCGGLAESLPLNAWLLRTLYAGLTVLSGGLFAPLYLMLWWALPQRWIIRTRRGGGAVWGLLALLLTAFMVALWVGRDQGLLRTDTGADLTLPLLLTTLAAVFFLRNLRG